MNKKDCETYEGKNLITMNKSWKIEIVINYCDYNSTNIIAHTINLE